MVRVQSDSASLTNQEIAEQLLAIAAELRRQVANPWRIEAYCTAAKVIQRLPRPLSEIVASEGVQGLRGLQIGKSLAASLLAYLKTGVLPPLARLGCQHEQPNLSRRTDSNECCI